MASRYCHAFFLINVTVTSFLLSLTSSNPGAYLPKMAAVDQHLSFNHQGCQLTAGRGLNLARGNGSLLTLGGVAVAVDSWRTQAAAYLLTHLRTDHTEGLSKIWSRGPIVCSVGAGAVLLSTTLELGPFVPALPSDETVIVLLGRDFVHLQVTLLQAHHCLVGCRDA